MAGERHDGKVMHSHQEGLAFYSVASNRDQSEAEARVRLASRRKVTLD